MSNPLARSVIALVCLSGTVAFGAADAEWPGWRGPTHDGKSPDTGLLKEWPAGGPKLVWQADGIGRGFSAVSVSGGRIYVTGDVDDPNSAPPAGKGKRRTGRLMLFALDMNGKLQWKQDVDKAWSRNKAGSRSTPTIDGGRLYLLSGNGIITCRDASTGKEKWKKSTSNFGGKARGWGYAESILIHGKLAILKPGGRRAIVALDKVTGRTVWISSGIDAAAEYSSCVPFTYEQKPCLVTGTREGIVCVDARTGKLLWSNPWCKGNTANCPDPAYADGFVFWSNGYGKGGICMKLSKAGGKVIAEKAWTTKEMVTHHGGYIIHEGFIYGNHKGGWACLDLKTGKRKWYERGVGKGSLCFADGMLYLFGEKGGKAGLATCSPDGMEMKGSFAVKGSGPSWAHPVVTGGRLYLRYDTHLYCFEIKAR